MTVSVFKHVSHNNDIVTHQESDYDGDTVTGLMSLVFWKSTGQSVIWITVSSVVLVGTIAFIIKLRCHCNTHLRQNIENQEQVVTSHTTSNYEGKQIDTQDNTLTHYEGLQYSGDNTEMSH